jgi:hypothetical protein
MVSINKIRKAMVPMLAAVIASLTLVAEVRSQGRKNPPPDKQVQEAVIQDRNFKEAEALREAFVLLSAANKDYDGHRAKAMHHVEAAIKVLDAAVMKKGTPQQKGATIQEDKSKDVAKVADREAPAAKENQVVSDDQLKAADVVLRKVGTVMGQNKQAKLLEHVTNAVKEIEAALKVR